MSEATTTEDIAKNKCNTETEEPWFRNLKSILCSLSPIPKGSRYSGVRFNALTRLVIYMTVLLIVFRVEKWYVFLTGGVILLGGLYAMKVNEGLREGYAVITSSNFGFLSEGGNKSEMDYKQITSHIPTNLPNGKSLETPFTSMAQPLSVEAARISADPRRMVSTQTANITNTYGIDEYTNKALNVRKEGGKRDPQAGIQYYTPYVGVNRKTMIPPIIGPRITDQDYWGKQSTVRSDINKLQIVDVTNEDINVSDMAQMSKRYPNAQPTPGGQVGYPLALPVDYRTRQPNAVWTMNRTGEDPDIGYYPSQAADLWNSQSVTDFDANVLPVFKNANSYPVSDVDAMMRTTPIPGINTNATPMYTPWKQPSSWVPPTQQIGLTVNQANYEMGVPMPPTKEGFYFVDTPTVPVDTSKLDANAQPLPSPQTAPQTVPQPQLASYYGQQPVTPLVDQFGNGGGRGVFGGKYSEVSRVPPGQNVQIPPVTDQLLPASPVYTFTDDYFQQPNTKYFLQDVQPKLYSYVVDQTPINSSVGISYAPQNPPRVLDQIQGQSLSMPLYSRIDPQLIRKDGTPGQLENQPTRTDWSAEYSNFQPAPGAINFEDIYDPRFNSYGDPYRSYSDVNLGQVQYYYSDVDAYKMPNYVVRSNVDFVDYRTPQGQIWPEYQRNIGLDEVRGRVENQTTADELFHREDLMSLQSGPANRRNYQLRYAPLRNGFHGGFGFGSST